MFNSKTPEDRIDDAIKYIGTLDPQLSNEIENRVKGNTAITIGRDISLGLFAKRIDKDRRIALRALLLCQRYYLSNLWSPTIQLDNLWKATSIDHWKSRQRSAIDRAILLFTATSNNATSLADVAETAGGPPNGHHVNYRLSRDERFNIGSGTCYVAMMVWLLKSGLVSYQWYLSNTSVTNIAGLKNKFGTPQQIWNPAQQFTMINQLPPVPRGYIVYINYREEISFGHWMVSLGNGMAAGCNNNITGGATANLYSNNATLDSQFYHGFNLGNATGTPRGVAYMFDPTQIPNRHMV